MLYKIISSFRDKLSIRMRRSTLLFARRLRTITEIRIAARIQFERTVIREPRRGRGRGSLQIQVDKTSYREQKRRVSSLIQDISESYIRGPPRCVSSHVFSPSVPSDGISLPPFIPNQIPDTMVWRLFRSPGDQRLVPPPFRVLSRFRHPPLWYLALYPHFSRWKVFSVWCLNRGSLVSWKIGSCRTLQKIFRC